MFHSYSCNLPTMRIPDPTSASEFISTGDSLMIHASGGAASGGQPFDLPVTAGASISLASGSTDPSAAATWSAGNAVALALACPGGACGPVTVNLQTSDNVVFDQKQHYANVTCTTLLTGSNNSVMVPATAVALLNQTAWKTVRTYVIRFGLPNIDAATKRTAAAGQGVLFEATRP
jgi:hypothetical protein